DDTGVLASADDHPVAECRADVLLDLDLAEGLRQPAGMLLGRQGNGHAPVVLRHGMNAIRSGYAPFPWERSSTRPRRSSTISPTFTGYRSRSRSASTRFDSSRE